MKVTAFELWLIRNDPEIREAPKREIAGIPLLAHSGAPMGGALLAQHKRACIALTGRGDKYCACAFVPADKPVTLPEGGR